MNQFSTCPFVLSCFVLFCMVFSKLKANSGMKNKLGDVFLP
jgi:hypothetical protein